MRVPTLTLEDGINIERLTEDIDLSVYHSRDLFDQHTRGWNAIKDSLGKCLSACVYSVPHPLRNHPSPSRVFILAEHLRP